VLAFLLSLVMIFGALSVALPANAQLDATNTGLKATAGQAGYGQEPVEVAVVIGRIIAIGIGLLGLILFVFIMYGGFIWMTAQGDSTKIQKAQGIIMNSVIGVIVVLSAYAVTNFAIGQLTNPATGILAP
jgi:hypothetical protein